MTPQSMLEFHNKRRNAENFVREEKYGYDLKHFPCQKLKANQAFASLAMLAHNLLRWAAIHDQPHRPKFSKKMRRMFIDIHGKMVSHGRTLTLKVSKHYFQEVNRLRLALGLKLYVSKLKVMKLNLINSPTRPKSVFYFKKFSTEPNSDLDLKRRAEICLRNLAFPRGFEPLYPP